MNDPRPKIMDEVLFGLTNDLSEQNLHTYAKINDVVSVPPVCSMLTGSKESASIIGALFIATELSFLRKEELLSLGVVDFGHYLKCKIDVEYKHFLNINRTVYIIVM